MVRIRRVYEALMLGLFLFFLLMPFFIVSRSTKKVPAARTSMRLADCSA